jgi:uncharacterized protein (TIGR03000 family)
MLRSMFKYLGLPALAIATVLSLGNTSDVFARGGGGGGRGGGGWGGGGWGGGRGWGGGGWGGYGWGGYGWGGRGWGGYGWGGYPYYGGYSSYYYPDYGYSYPDYGYSSPDYGNYGYYGSTYSYPNNYAYQPADDSDYPTAGGEEFSRGTGNEVYLRVQVPSNAQLWVDGQRTRQSGPMRTFVSPPLNGTGDFTYNLRAEWNQGGQTVTRNKDVVVHPGEQVTVNMMTAQGGIERGTFNGAEGGYRRGYDRGFENRRGNETGTYDNRREMNNTDRDRDLNNRGRDLNNPDRRDMNRNPAAPTPVDRNRTTPRNPNDTNRPPDDTNRPPL